jgi:hypothetical protein
MKPNPGMIVIFGQYKSGTTGLFTKVRNSLPENTRTLFESLTYDPEEGDPFRWVLAKTILKEPGHPEPVNYKSFMRFDRRLLLSRDPRDWLISATLFICQLKESVFNDENTLAWVMDYLYRKEENPRELSVITLLDYILSTPPAITLESFAHRAKMRHAFCIEFQQSLGDAVQPIRYEDFVDGQLSIVENYLEIPLTGDAQVQAAYNHVPRTCSYGNWRDWLTPEDIHFFKPFFDDYIRYQQYDPDWCLHEFPMIQPAHCSGYLRRVVQKKLSCKNV